MDGLKQSLEQAIKEMQDLPAAASPDLPGNGELPAVPVLLPVADLKREPQAAEQSKSTSLLGTALSSEKPSDNQNPSDHQSPRAGENGSGDLALPVAPALVPVSAFADELTAADGGAQLPVQPSPVQQHPSDRPRASNASAPSNNEAHPNGQTLPNGQTPPAAPAGQRPPAGQGMQNNQAVSERQLSPQQEGAVPQPDLPPAVNSIAAALASAPSVSPNYVPPPAGPVVPVARTAPQSARPVQSAETKVQAGSARPEVRAASPQQGQITKPAAQNKAAVLQTAADLASRAKRKNRTAGSPVPKDKQSVVQSSPVTGPENKAGTNLTGGSAPDDIVVGDKKFGSNAWRWATICISCVGGLASGYAGSSMSDGGGLFASSQREVAGTPSQASSMNMPAMGLKSRDGADTAKPSGKTDRAMQIDKNHCTVLALIDRRTGTVLKKPCNVIETAGYNSTLRKEDLLAKPGRERP